MSASVVDNKSTNGLESKYYKMKKLVAAIAEYLQTRGSDVTTNLNRYLQALSMTIDLSIFDPHTNIAAEFFVSLYELMNKIEQRTPFAWYCVDLLSNICRNSSARHALIHTYQFLPSLSRLLGDQLTIEKKIRLLKLMQDLTCGIKISWQIPHLPHLLTTLAKWVESADEEIVTLSLGVLVNLCYKNLPAIYTLSTNVDIKKMCKICLPLRGPIVEVHSCKLLIILDYMNDEIPKSTTLTLVGATFRSIIEAFSLKDPILLRQVVEFFLDVQKQSIKRDAIKEYENYEEQVENLIRIVTNNVSANACGDGAYDTQDPECMALVFSFLNSLIKLELPCLRKLDSKFIDLALNWIQTDIVSSPALSILMTIAINTPEENSSLLYPLVKGLPVFILALNSDTTSGEIPTHTEYNKKIGALLQLFKALVRVDSLRPKIMQELKEETLYKVFIPLIGDNSPRVRANDVDTSSLDAINLYVYAIALVAELAKYDVSWVTIFESLLEEKQIHVVIAQALYGSSKEVKSLIFNLTSHPNFPKEAVSTTMASLSSTMHLDHSNARPSNAYNDLSFPVLSVAQVERVDQVLMQIKEVMSDRNVMNISTSDLMELYEYKLASMGHAERGAMASLEAASERATQLQHRTAQLTAELNRFHQLLFHSEQCLEQAVKGKDEQAKITKELTNALEAERGRTKAAQSQLKIKEKALTECLQINEDITKKLNDVSRTKADLEEQCTKLRQAVIKLEESSTRLEKVVVKKDDIIKRNHAHMEKMKQEIQELRSSLKHHEAELQSKNTELKEITSELQQRQKIIDTITRVATQHMPSKSESSLE